jgi:hypothetical protein
MSYSEAPEPSLKHVTWEMFTFHRYAR